MTVKDIQEGLPVILMLTKRKELVWKNRYLEASGSYFFHTFLVFWVAPSVIMSYTKFVQLRFTLSTLFARLSTAYRILKSQIVLSSLLR